MRPGSKTSTLKKVSKIVIATTKKKEDKILSKYVVSDKVDIFFGSDSDVYSRFLEIKKLYKPDYIIRITGDCPLIDAGIVDKLIYKIINSKKDYITNDNPRTYPDGLDAEVITFKALKKCYGLVKNKFDKEHVTTYVRSSRKFNIIYDNYKHDFSHLRWVVDEKSDLNKEASPWNMGAYKGTWNVGGTQIARQYYVPVTCISISWFYTNSYNLFCFF